MISLPTVTRLALTMTPGSKGPFDEQMQEVVSVLESVMLRRPPLLFTMLTFFLRHAEDRLKCEQALADFFGPQLPVINIVLEPPCCGAAVAVEAWAIGGEGVSVEQLAPQTIAVNHDGVRWIYCGGIKSPDSSSSSVYRRTFEALLRMQDLLALSETSFGKVVRTWFYLGGITASEAGGLRYQQLNRARADFYRNFHFQRRSIVSRDLEEVYPASTGIGTQGDSVSINCLAVETERKDVFLTPLENPQQTPAYSYPIDDSGKPPMFSRAMALVVGNYVTTWISGTASIVNSRSCHIGNVERQTEQTIENIERLISQENFRRHGIAGAAGRLSDLAKIRVYLKRPEDLARCRAICERRFGRVPALYLTADICRPELLVEIEGVAFFKRLTA